MKRSTTSFVILACLVSLLSACGDGNGHDSSPSQLTLSFDPTSLPAATVNVPYEQSVVMTASGGAAPYFYSCAISNKDSGLSASVSSANPTNGGVSCIVSGTPLNTSEVTVNCSVTDSKASAFAGPLSIIISPTPDPLDVWHMRSSLPEGIHLSDVTYGNGTFVAVGSNDIANRGAILTSADGITWTFLTTERDETVTSVTFGNGIFVATAFEYFNFDRWGTRLLTSVDGITWTPRMSKTYISVIYGNGIFITTVIVSDFFSSQSEEIMTSVDGINWTPQLFSVEPRIYGEGIFVGFKDGTIMTSVDALTWTSGTEIDERYLSFTYGNGIFVAVGNSGGIYASDDGVTWRTLPSISASLRAVTYGKGIFVTVGFRAPSSPDMLTPGVIFTSPDGVIWTSRNTGAGALSGVTYGNGTFVAVGGNQIIQSDPMQ